MVIGNCGFGFAPVLPELRDRSMLALTRNEAIPLASMQQGIPWDWVTYPEYLDSVDRTPKSVNVLPYVGLTPLLIWVMGMERAKAGELPTDAEHAEMRRLLHEAMDAGACGWSVQRMSNDINFQRDYDGTALPTDVMHDETAYELAAVLGERNDGFMQMTLARSKFDPSDDRAHVERLAEISRRPIIWNALAPIGAAPVHRDVINWLDSCIERGLRVYAQSTVTEAPHVLHVRGLEPLGRLAGLARCHDRHEGGTAREARRPGPPRRDAGATDDGRILRTDRRHRAAAHERSPSTSSTRT